MSSRYLEIRLGAELLHILQQASLQLLGCLLRTRRTHLLTHHQFKVLHIRALGAGIQMLLNRAQLLGAQLPIEEFVEVLEGRRAGLTAAIL